MFSKTLSFLSSSNVNKQKYYITKISIATTASLLLYFLPSISQVINTWESITEFKVIWSAELNPRHKILNSYSKESEITTVGNVEQIGLYVFSFVIWIWTFLRAHVRTTTHRSSLLLSTYCPHWTTERTQRCSSGTATECGIPLRCSLMFHAFIMGYIIGKSGWPLWLVLRTHLTNCATNYVISHFPWKYLTVFLTEATFDQIFYHISLKLINFKINLNTVFSEAFFSFQIFPQKFCSLYFCISSPFFSNGYVLLFPKTLLLLRLTTSKLLPIP